MFYGFTEVYHVNVNNALELAYQGVHYIGFKHKAYIINDSYVNDIFITENWTGQELLLLLWIYILIIFIKSQNNYPYQIDSKESDWGIHFRIGNLYLMMYHRDLSSAPYYLTSLWTIFHMLLRRALCPLTLTTLKSFTLTMNSPKLKKQSTMNLSVLIYGLCEIVWRGTTSHIQHNGTSWRVNWWEIKFWKAPR